MTETLSLDAQLVLTTNPQETLAVLPALLNAALGDTQGIVSARPHPSADGFVISNDLIQIDVTLVQGDSDTRLRLRLSSPSTMSRGKLMGKLAQLVLPLVRSLDVQTVLWGRSEIALPAPKFVETLTPFVDDQPVIRPRRVRPAGARVQMDAHVQAYQSNLSRNLRQKAFVPPMRDVRQKGIMKLVVATERQAASAALGLCGLVMAFGQSLQIGF